MPTSRKTLQEIIRERQESAFVGRKEQLSLFEENLSLPLSDPRRYFVFNIHGNAGVGKTYLLQYLLRIARSRQAAIAEIDEVVDIYRDRGHVRLFV